jgi:photosystem II stability/assembly factor-like uncharacterized protein
MRFARGCFRLVTAGAAMLLLVACGGTGQVASGDSAAPNRRAARHGLSDRGAAGPVAGPVPKGFHVGSVTAINGRMWWVLGFTQPRGCRQAGCLAIIRTTDAGRRFVAIPAPGVPYVPEPAGAADGVSEIYFANSRDGYVYDQSLFVTHDGGATWRPIRYRGLGFYVVDVVDVTSSGGEAYALVQIGSGAFRVVRSPVGRDIWSQVPESGYVVSIAARGNDLFLTTTRHLRSHVLVSRDRGASIARRYPAPTENGCTIQPAPQSVFWALCPGGMMSTLYRSTGHGRTLRHLSHAPQLTNSAVFAAASPSTAVVGYGRLYRTEDAGNTFTPVPPPRTPLPANRVRWMYVTFTDPAPRANPPGTNHTRRAAAAIPYLPLQDNRRRTQLPIRFSPLRVTYRLATRPDVREKPCPKSIRRGREGAKAPNPFRSA